MRRFYCKRQLAQTDIFINGITFFAVENGGWSNWGKWTQCSVTCGNGFKHRHRYCEKPEPKYDGDKCEGTNHQRIACYRGFCPSKLTFYFQLCMIHHQFQGAT